MLLLLPRGDLGFGIVFGGVLTTALLEPCSNGEVEVLLEPRSCDSGGEMGLKLCVELEAIGGDGLRSKTSWILEQKLIEMFSSKEIIGVQVFHDSASTNESSSERNLVISLTNQVYIQ